MLRCLLLICYLLMLTVACSDEDADHDDVHDSASDHDDNREGVRDDAHRDNHVGGDEHEHDNEDRKPRGHGAHEHGQATLTIAWSGTDLAIDLQIPAYNILGFEYAPSTGADKELLSESIATLKTGGLMRLTPEAECAIVAADVETELTETEDDHGEEEKSHSDFDVFYSVQCKKPDELVAVDASGLFTAFPNFAAIRVQWISDSGQAAKTLTAEDAILSFD